MIVDVRTARLRARLHTPFVTALRRTTTVETVVVRLTDSDGFVGYGEAPQVLQVTGESLAGAQACLDGPLAAAVDRRDPDDLVPLLHAVDGAVHANPGAKAAIDVALHDLVARRRGLPLPTLLGATRLEVTTDVTLSVGEADALEATARRRRDEGFSVVKLKVGTDARADVARVRAVRDALGSTVQIRLDANQGWTAREAVQAITAMEDSGLDVELVEQPVAAADLRAMAWVRDRVGTPILADESVFGVRDLVEVIRLGAADMVNVKLAKCGGLAPARTLLEVARAHGVGTVVGSMMETHIGVGAAASLVAAFGTTAVPDLDAAWWTAEPPFTGGLVYEGATLQLPNSPGLGIGVDL